jgi:hypothetical protein
MFPLVFPIVLRKDHLSGVKVLHGLDKVIEGGAVVMTLKDQSILADGDINEGNVVLVLFHLLLSLVPSDLFLTSVKNKICRG